MYPQHPLSAAFPAIGADDFQALKDSIENIGVQNPITLFEGMVIDGWHRYSAANDLGMNCPAVELGDVDPRDFVLAQNKARRHVTQAQLAMATTAVYAWKPVGNPEFAQSNTQCSIAKTNDELAEIAGVGVQTIRQAKAVQTNAAPEVVAAVKSGAIGLPKAAAIAKLPQAEQAAAIAKPAPKPTPKPAAPKPAPVVEPKEPSLADQVREETGAGDFDAAASEVQELRSGYLLVAEENQRLLDENAALKADGTTEEQDAAQALISELRETNRIQGLELDAVKVSRDIYLNENAQLKKQIKFYQRKLKELEA